MQCAAPNIRDRGQSEVAVSSYINGRFQGAGTYSPVRHLLIHAAGSFMPPPSSSTDSAAWERQFDAGIGTYWDISPIATVGAIGGYGRGESWASFSETARVGSRLYHDYALQFYKTFGEIYFSIQASRTLALGAAYRLTQVTFTSLTDRGQAVDLSGMVRYEPMLFLRRGLGSAAGSLPPFEIKVAYGLSFGEKDFGYGRDVLQPRGYTTLGLSFYPHRVKWRK